MFPDAAIAILALVAIAVWFAGPWQELCTAWARQVIFEVRDAIFDLAAKGQMSFESEDYRTIRRSLEQLIRFAHEASFLALVLQVWAVRRANRGQMSGLSVALAGIHDAEVKATVTRLVWRAQSAMLVMVIARSPAVLPLSLVLLASRLFRKRRPLLQLGAEAMQIEAEHDRPLTRAPSALAA